MDKEDMYVTAYIKHIQKGKYLFFKCASMPELYYYKPWLQNCESNISFQEKHVVKNVRDWNVRDWNVRDEMTRNFHESVDCNISSIQPRVVLADILKKTTHVKK